jgi:acetyl esterase/lipase
MRSAVVLLGLGWGAAVLGAACGVDADDGASAGSGSTSAGGSGGAPAAAWTVRDVAYGDDPAQRIDVYVPAGASGAPAVIYVHGGAWALGAKENVGSKAELVNGLGMVFVSVEYRLSPNPPSNDPGRVMHPDHIDDVTAAVAFVAEHASEYGIDAQRIGLMGHSAGAHLVALASTDPSRAQPRVRCVFANDTEALDIPRALETASATQQALYANAFGTDPDVLVAASPITYVSGSTPPFLLTRRGAPDRQAVLEGFVDALSAAGIAHTVIDAVGLSHEEVNELVGEASDSTLTPEVEAFFAECLADGA